MGKLVRVALIIVGLAGCATPPLPEDHYYRLEIDAPIASSPERKTASVTLARIRMPGVYSERPLLYSTAQAPTELRQYHYHYWADNPERLVQDRLAAFLRAAQIFRDVSVTTNGAAAYQISGSVQRFEQRLDGSNAHAFVEINLATSAR